MASPTADASSSARFTSRWGLILSVLGIAVGTGNIWRFPRIAASNAGDGGAGAFLVAWLVFLLVWSIPLIIAEYALGQRGRMGVVGTFAKLAGPKVAWLGAFVAFVAAAIMCYYSVVAGWCAYFMATSLASGLPVTSESSLAAWQAFQASPWPIVLHAAMMGLGVLAVRGGVGTIEKANKILVPTLLAIVVVAVVRAVTLPGAGAGIAYLFTPDWGTLAAPSTWLEALTQNAWDTGAGWGLILTYAAYMVISKQARTELDSSTYQLSLTLVALATVLPIALVVEGGVAMPVADDWWLLVAMAVLPGSGHLLVNVAHGYTSLTMVSLVNLAFTAVAPLYAWWLVGEGIGGTQAVGMTVVMLALGFVVTRPVEMVGR